MVGARRFELPTPTTPLWCATRLRYAPTGVRNRGQWPLLLGGNNNRHLETWKERNLAPENLEDLFKFHAYLLDYLLTLRDI